MRLRHAFVVLAGGVLAAACVDLFHATDFATLCTVDAAACAPDAGFEAETSIPVTALPLLDFCAWSSDEARMHAERACGWLGACEGAAAGSTFGLCMTRALDAYDCHYNPGLRPAGDTYALWSCLATVTSCGGVSRCLYGAMPPTCDAVPSGNGTFTACSNIGSSTILSCALPDAGSPAVASESCTLEARQCNPNACVGQEELRCTHTDTCSGTNAVRCQAENTLVDIGLDCARRGGGTCVASDAGVACAPIADAGACDGGVEVRCDDAGAAHSCVAGQDVVVNCTAVGRACRAAAHPLDIAAACTVLDGGSCSDADEGCTDGILRSCAHGELFPLDCAHAGLTNGCEVPSAPFLARARCKRP